MRRVQDAFVAQCEVHSSCWTLGHVVLLELSAQRRRRRCFGAGPRLTAQLGLRTPYGPTLFAGADDLSWAEGKVTLFDDSHISGAHWPNEGGKRDDRTHVVLSVRAPWTSADEPWVCNLCAANAE